MSNRQYPYISGMDRRKAEQSVKCERCGKMIHAGGWYWLVTTQTSWFRGEDDVDAWCDACKEAVRPTQTPAPPKPCKCKRCGGNFPSQKARARHDKGCRINAAKRRQEGATL